VTSGTDPGGGSIYYPIDDLAMMGIPQKNRQQTMMDMVMLAFGSGVIR
jgi:hypothetical protein